jgi:hypothetical protein
MQVSEFSSLFVAVGTECLLLDNSSRSRPSALTGHQDFHCRHTVIQERRVARWAALCTSTAGNKTAIDVKDLAGCKGGVLEI